MRIEIDVPIKVVSESNACEHWRRKHQRCVNMRKKIKIFFIPYVQKISLPCEVTLIRIAPRFLDDDNLVGAFKYIRDAVADLIIPGLAHGRADADPRIKWVYIQRKDEPKKYSCKIVIQNS